MSTYQMEAPAGAVYPERGFALKAGQHAREFAQSALRLIVRALAEYRAHRAMQELQQLDDRMLRDIGVERAAIEHAVRYGRDIEVASFARLAGPFRR